MSKAKNIMKNSQKSKKLLHFKKKYDSIPFAKNEYEVERHERENSSPI